MQPISEFESVRTVVLSDPEFPRCRPDLVFERQKMRSLTRPEGRWDMLLNVVVVLGLAAIVVVWVTS